MDRHQNMFIHEKNFYEKEKKQSYDRLEIFTLGQFLVKRGDNLLTLDAGRSSKLWKLFKYLFSYRGKTTEELMESLYPEEELLDPERTLRNLVYRLRRFLAAGLPPGSDPQYIIMSQGMYFLNPSSNYWLDADEFKKLCSEARMTASKEPAKAIDIYHQALSLYNGYYLPESFYDDWVVPVRNYYHRLYLESVYKQIELLREAGRYQELRNVCEKTFLIEPYQEDLHICFIEALLEEGRSDLAKTHYNYASSLLYRETGMKPSVAMRDLYKKITNYKKPQVEDWPTPARHSAGGSEAGAFFCDPDIFLKLYRLEERRAERNEQPVFWGCLELTHPDFTVPEEKKLTEAMDFVEKVLRRNLRKGDIVCRWNKNQFYLMLECLNHEQAKKALDRVVKRCADVHLFSDIILQSTSSPLKAMEATGKTALGL
ncbi:MAG: diguanylate cyclase [Firmicutes bacterium]|nr:diguanylate cyclase [Bacillota bacterium]